MKVLHLRASNFYGGPERQLHLHAREAAAHGLHVLVASFQEAGQRPEFLDRIESDGIEVHVLAVRSAYDASAVARLRSLLRAEAIDILCTHDYRSNFIGWLARAGLPCRWLAFSRGFTRENWKLRVFQRMDSVLIRAADEVVAVSAAQGRRMRALGVAAERLSVVANAIDVGLLQEVGASDLRARFRLPEDSYLCVAGGRFSVEKGQADLIEAADRALKEEPRLRFLLFGDGPEREPLLRSIAERGRRAEILCPGFEPSMLSALRGADLLVNPSHSEGLPNIVLEAMAASIPVLATAVGGVPELIEDGISGRLVPAAQPDALAAALLDCARDQEAARQRAAQALRVVADEYSFARQHERLAAIYARLAG